MTEIDVSAIWQEDCYYLSASRAELGDNAGSITWENCLALAERLPLVTEDNRDDLRDHFRGYGAWTREEIEAWTDAELSALVWQESAACMREFRELCDEDFDDYEAECERGTISGRLTLSEGFASYYVGC